MNWWFPIAALGLTAPMAVIGFPPKELTKCIAHYSNKNVNLGNLYCHLKEELQPGNWVRIRTPIWDPPNDDFVEVMQFGFMSKDGRKNWSLDPSKLPVAPFWVPHGENVTHPLIYARLLRIAHESKNKRITVTLVSHYVRGNAVVKHYSRAAVFSHHLEDYLEIIVLYRNDGDLDVFVGGERVENIEVPEFYPKSQFRPISYRFPKAPKDASHVYAKGLFIPCYICTIGASVVAYCLTKNARGRKPYITFHSTCCINFIEYIRNKKQSDNNRNPDYMEIVVFPVLSIPSPYPVALLPGGLLYGDTIELVGFLYDTVEIRLITKLKDPKKWTIYIKQNGTIQFNGIRKTVVLEQRTFDRYPRILSTITITKTLSGLLILINARREFPYKNETTHDANNKYNCEWDSSIKYVEIREGYSVTDIDHRNLFIFASIPRATSKWDPIFI